MNKKRKLEATLQLGCVLLVMSGVANAQVPPAPSADVRQQGEQQERRQQEREGAQRGQLQPAPQVSSPSVDDTPEVWPQAESPCFNIKSLVLDGDASETFQWILEDMALEMRLELEGDDPDWSAIEVALIAAGAAETSLLKGDKKSSTWFPTSGLHVTALRYSDAPRDAPSAEGDHQCSFSVSWLLIFRINANADYDQSVSAIHKFLSELTKISSMQFVLSFQGEEVRALRDVRRGFEWFWDDPR